MTWVLATLAATGWLLAVICLTVVASRRRRQSLKQAARLRTYVRAYLIHRAAEVGVPTSETGSANLEQLVEDLCAIADRLIRNERGGTDPGTIAIADTVNMSSDTDPIRRP